MNDNHNLSEPLYLLPCSQNTKMTSENQKVRIFLCSGGSWKVVNGILEFTPLGLMKRFVDFPSIITTHSGLVDFVTKKLRLTDKSSEIRLTYKLPARHDVIKLVDDDDVLVFIDVVLQENEIITLYVVECDGNGGNESDTGSKSDTGSNQVASFFPANVTPNCVDKSAVLEHFPQKKQKRVSDIGASNEHEEIFKRNKQNLQISGFDAGENNFWGMPSPELEQKPYITPRLAKSVPTPFIRIGEVFESKEALKEALKLKCAEEGFEVKVKRSSKERFWAVCSSKKCEWRIRATSPLFESTFKVIKLEDRHTCLDAK